LHDRWIMSRLQRASYDVGRALESYDFHAAVQTLYHFFWDDFCDWYIELSKADVTVTEATLARNDARSRVLTILEQALRLLHPFMPFITEDLWQRLPGIGSHFLHSAYKDAEPTIMLTSYPQARMGLIDERAEADVQSLIELVSRVRNIRSEMNIKPGEPVRIMIAAPDADARAVFESGAQQIARLVRASDILIGETINAPRASARAVLAGGAEVAVPLEGLIDFAKEHERLNNERGKLEKEAAKLEAQLANSNFVERAPAEKVEELRQRLADLAQRTRQLTQTVEALSE
ncbi:MAG: class I tRNA ligase family protein, partial [Acidobacteria bacterium]|nr:class I tRNA ligase family protein [Acidobacteriota bacterium]